MHLLQKCRTSRSFELCRWDCALAWHELHITLRGAAGVRPATASSEDVWTLSGSVLRICQHYRLTCTNWFAGDAAPDEDISYASLFASSQPSESGSQSHGPINGAGFTPWAPQTPSALANASWGFPGSAFSQPSQQQQQPQNSGMQHSPGYTTFPTAPAVPGASINGGVNGVVISTGTPAASSGMASEDAVRFSSTLPQPESTGGPATMPAASADVSKAAITPELLASLQELLQKAQQPGADVVQITQAVMQRLQQQLPPDLVMSVLQQASGLQFDLPHPTSVPAQTLPAHSPGLNLAGSASLNSFRVPSPGTFHQSTSPHPFPASNAQNSQLWNGMPLGPQSMGFQRPSSVGNGVSQAGGVAQSPQLSPADMMMRLQLENQQRNLLGPGMSRPQGPGALPNHLAGRPGFATSGIPNRPAGFMPGINPAQGSADHLSAYLQSPQARAMRPESQQMLQFQVCCHRCGSIMSLTGAGAYARCLLD